MAADAARARARAGRTRSRGGRTRSRFALGGLATHLAQIPHWGSAILDARFVRPRRGDRPAGRPSDVARRSARDVRSPRRRSASRRWSTRPTPSCWRRGRSNAAATRDVACPRIVGASAVSCSTTSIHHRGQMTVYLRLQDVPLPPIYGPTADEAHVSRLGRRSPAAARAVRRSLATANSGGYRYGVSDQAFYAAGDRQERRPVAVPARPAAARAADAGVARRRRHRAGRGTSSALDLPPLFAAIYLVTLVVLFAAAVVVRAQRSAARGGIDARAARVADAAPSHREDRRELARRLHAPANARVRARASLRSRACCAGAVPSRSSVVVAAAVVHSDDRALVRRRGGRARCWHAVVAARWIVAAVAGAGVIAHLGRCSRPLGRSLPAMDAGVARGARRQGLPVPARVAALRVGRSTSRTADRARADLPAASRARISRARRGRARRRASSRSWSCFLSRVPLSAGASRARRADCRSTASSGCSTSSPLAYLAWWLDRRRAADAAARCARRVALVAAIAHRRAVRGLYVLRVETGGRSSQSTLPPDDWTDAMTLARARSRRPWHVLADPGHAWKYGVERPRRGAQGHVARERQGHGAGDVRSGRGDARRANEPPRSRDFDAFTTGDVRALGARFGLDVLVVDAQPDLRAARCSTATRDSWFTTFDDRTTTPPASRRSCRAAGSATATSMTVFAWARRTRSFPDCRRPRRGCSRSPTTRRCSRAATGSRIGPRGRRSSRCTASKDRARRTTCAASPTRPGGAAGTRCCSISATAAAPSI